MSFQAGCVLVSGCLVYRWITETRQTKRDPDVRGTSVESCIKGDEVPI